mmetsp:Transcript_50123/g.125677  ORF Transcript_50123/g.125677 Transcript_50123/m.125677 type:complete len:210 (+) Transcript_50123:983-1612(+)
MSLGWQGSGVLWVKKGCSRAALAVTRHSGSSVSILSSRSTPVSSQSLNLLRMVRGKCLAGLCFSHSGSRTASLHVVLSGPPHNLKIISSMCFSLSPLNRGFPVISSANMHPADQMSTAVPYLTEPSSSSGGLYHSVFSVGGVPLLGRLDTQPGKTEIAQFELAFLRQQQVGTFDISVYDVVLVAVLQPLQQLTHQTLDLTQIKLSVPPL